MFVLYNRTLFYNYYAFVVLRISYLKYVNHYNFYALMADGKGANGRANSFAEVAVVLIVDCRQAAVLMSSVN